jgi:hypothetical protein
MIYDFLIDDSGMSFRANAEREREILPDYHLQTQIAGISRRFAPHTNDMEGAVTDL